MIGDRRRTLRGALAGACAAAVWAAQMELDKRVLRSDFDDVELLGKVFTRSGAWRGVGLALHLQNGALFGAAYANIAPSVPLPAWSLGPLAALVEHLGSWPLTGLSDRHHPARAEMPAIARSHRAFVQATWRHLLFGVVLGVVERRLNTERREVAVYPISPNGHGTTAHASAAVRSLR